MSLGLIVAISAGVTAAVVFATFAFVAPEMERKHRRARARDLAMYRHLPEANLLELND